MFEYKYVRHVIMQKQHYVGSASLLHSSALLLVTELKSSEDKVAEVNLVMSLAAYFFVL